MNKSRNIKRIVVVIISIMVVIGGAFLVSYFSNSIAPADVEAAGLSKISLELARERDVRNLKKKGDSFTINITVANKEKQNVGELVLKFDPTYWEVGKFTTNSELIALNKVIDNTGGKVSVDLALPGPSNIPTQGTLGSIVLTLKKDAPPKTSLISVDKSSVLGFPNVLKPESGYGTLTATFPNGK